MKSKYQWTLTLKFTELHIIYFLVIVAHIVFLYIAVDKDDYYSYLPEDAKTRIAKSEDDQKAKEERELSTLEKLKLLQSNQYYGLVYRGNVEQKYQSKLAKLLGTNFSNNIQRFSNESSNYTLSTEETRAIQNSDISIKLTEAELNNFALNLLKQQKTEYSKCYHRFQKLDELLEGHVDLKITTGANQVTPVVNFKGVGQKNVIRQLEGCIANNIRTIHFPTVLNNKTYKLKILL